MLIPLKYNIRYLFTRWGSTLMTGGTFALVVAIFIIVMSMVRGIERSLTMTASPLNVLIMRKGVQAEGQSSVTNEQYQIVRNYPGIARDLDGEPLAAPEVLVLVNKPRATNGESTNLQIRGVDPRAFRLRPEVKIVAGRNFRPGLREMIVSRPISGRFQGMKLGDTPVLGRAQWRIVGIFDAQGTAFNSEAWTDKNELMQEFDRAAYTTVVARVTDPGAVAEIQRRVEDDRRVKLEAKTERQYYEDQTKVTAGPLKAFGVFLAVLMSIGACFAGMNTMYASIASRVREIGTLRILGYTPFSIMVSFLIESIFLALTGGALGCLLAFFINTTINRHATGMANFATFSEIVFYFAVTPELMTKGIIFAMIMGAIGGLLPAISASRQPILKCLKQI